MKIKKNLLAGLIICLMPFGLLVLKFTGQEQQVCVEYTNSFTENFDTVVYKDAKKCSVSD